MIEDDRSNRGSEPFVTGVRGQVPPLVTTNFLVKDQGKIFFLNKQSTNPKEPLRELSLSLQEKFEELFQWLGVCVSPA